MKARERSKQSRNGSGPSGASMTDAVQTLSLPISIRREDTVLYSSKVQWCEDRLVSIVSFWPPRCAWTEHISGTAVPAWETDMPHVKRAICSRNSLQFGSGRREGGGRMVALGHGRVPPPNIFLDLSHLLRTAARIVANGLIWLQFAMEPGLACRPVHCALPRVRFRRFLPRVPSIHTHGRLRL
jgi:hypothetical protein